jgi:hypothetical protein
MIIIIIIMYYYYYFFFLSVLYESACSEVLKFMACIFSEIMTSKEPSKGHVLMYKNE